jgi:hypothetical protein
VYPETIPQQKIKFLDFLSDVQIHTALIPRELADTTARGVLWQAAPGRFLLQVPGVARYQVQDGHRITIDPVEQDGILSHDDEIIRFLHLTPLAALLYQRGMLAFHASALVPPLREGDRKGGAILLAGDSGAGKSTLLAALQQCGWTPLADDLAAVGLGKNDRPIVYPTLCDIRLWPDAKEKLKLQETPEISENLGDLAAQPLRAIYWLSVHSWDNIEYVSLKGAERFEALGKLTYNSYIADALLDRAAYFRLAAAVTQSVSLHRLRRPRGRWSVEELVQKIEKEWL